VLVYLKYPQLIENFIKGRAPLEHLLLFFTKLSIIIFTPFTCAIACAFAFAVVLRKKKTKNSEL
jgi:hypothetical protein